jgi:hypothetical protein
MSDIIDLTLIKNKINKFESLTSGEMPKLYTVFTDETVSDKMQRFFDIADGSSIWNN